ncbi:carbohydrate kinase [Actinoplanes sichuanensis]|uniref:Carbohydrate kinase n=1 Tax=Actinoplanes sichuanensis TaxID=512349 RepID=A0ABW4ACY3_9ACTN|nr:carbohydrate kinase [Actinoplanes sichuanensis]BEL08849.1 carbohydrate kinase [Actinoplanes sichuanensis]
MGYAMVMGEALIDLLEADVDGEQVYRQAIGGAPLNVAVGVARLGGDARYAGSLSIDILGDRMAAFLRAAGVDGQGVRRVAAPTTLAVTTFDGAEPTFTFYGEPPSYALLAPADLDLPAVAGAAVLYTGSISLLREPFLSAARAAWSAAVPGPLRVFDPNVRPTLLPDAAAVAALRDLTEEFFATADLVKLSSADAIVLYDEHDPAAAAARILALGAGAVVVTCGSRGAHVAAADGATDIPAPLVSAIDATGAGDSVMAALISRLLTDGRPTDLAAWSGHVRFALSVAGLVCERQGGATAMPTPSDLRARWGDL